MSKTARASLLYLQILAKCKPKVGKAVIEHGFSDLVLSICECCYKVLKRTIPQTVSQKNDVYRDTRNT